MSTSNVFECDDAISFKFGASKSGKYLFTIYKKELQLTRVNVKVKNDFETVPVVLTLPTDVNADGVLRVTVTDSDDHPVAERLIFRKQTKKLKVNVVTDYKSFCPGDKVKLRLLTTDESGNAGILFYITSDLFIVSAKVCVTVTDESVIESVEKRKHHPNLDAMVYLESDVHHLDDATIYLSEDPISEKATDLLLGTQGWRRFAYDDIMKFIKEKGEKGEKIACIHQGEEKPYSSKENPFLTKQDISKIEYFEFTKFSKQQDSDTDSGSDWSSNSDSNSNFRDEEEEDESENDYLEDLAPPPPPPPTVSQSQNSPSVPFASRSSLLESIRAPTMLKKVSAPAPKEAKAPKQDDMMSSLLTKLSTRRQNLDGEKKKSYVPLTTKKEKSINKNNQVISVENESVKEKEQEITVHLGDYNDSLNFPTSKSVSIPISKPKNIIREFAYKISPNRKQGSRVDFTETIYW